MGTQCETAMWFCSMRRLWLVGPSWKVNLCAEEMPQGLWSRGNSLPPCHGQNWTTRLQKCQSRELWTTPTTGIAPSWPRWCLGLESQTQGWLPPALLWKSRLGQVKPPFPFSSPSHLLSLQGEWTQKNVSFREEHFNHELSIVPEQWRRNVQIRHFYCFGGRSERKSCTCTALRGCRVILSATAHFCQPWGLCCAQQGDGEFV